MRRMNVYRYPYSVAVMNKFVGKRVLVKFEYPAAPGGIRLFIARIKWIEDGEIVFSEEEWTSYVTSPKCGRDGEQLSEEDVNFICECPKRRQSEIIMGAIL